MLYLPHLSIHLSQKSGNRPEICVVIEHNMTVDIVFSLKVIHGFMVKII